MSANSQKNILLVEDQRSVAEIEKLSLEKLGYKVQVADTGEKAIETAKENPVIDLILMDIELGKGIDGAETARIILQSRDVPIIFLSSYTTPEVIKKTEEIASYGYVLKKSGMTPLHTSMKTAFKLFEANQNIKAANDELERRVVERTKNLQAKNDELQTEIKGHRQTLSELKKAKEAAEEANAAKSKFLSSMSHELRTPMNAILGFGQILEMDKSLSAAQKDFTREITTAGRHLLDLINDVLDLSRIETGKLDLSMKPLACTALVQKCLELVEHLAAKRAIRIELKTGPDLTILADPALLQQVLLNLLSNAVKYNRAGGQVWVEVSSAKDMARISVSDSGMGIPKARMKELFIPFNRLGAENGTIEGTGIGLTICKRLVEEMGGSIGVESTEGTGSKFWIEFKATGDSSGQGENNGND